MTTDGQLVHNGEHYQIRKTNDALAFQWNLGDALTELHRSQAWVDNSLSGILGHYGKMAIVRHEDELVHSSLLVRAMCTVADLVLEDARRREQALHQSFVHFITHLLFMAPSMRLQLHLDKGVLAGGTFASGVSITHVQTIRLTHGANSYADIEFATEGFGVVHARFFQDEHSPFHLTPVLTLHTDANSVPPQTSLKYLATRQVAANLVPRCGDTAFVSATVKRVWGGFYQPPPDDDDAAVREPLAKRRRLDTVNT